MHPDIIQENNLIHTK